MKDQEEFKFEKDPSYQNFFRIFSSIIFIGLLITTGGFILNRPDWLIEGMAIGFFAFCALVTCFACFRAMEKFGNHKYRIPLFFLAVFLIAAIAFSQPASAADLNPTNAPLKQWIDIGNSANGLLCSTVGDLGTGLFGSCTASSSGFSSVLKTFNLAVFTIASIFIAWTIISSMISSAADGKFLGKANHSTWGPMRVVIGGAMLVPAFGGFNLAQLTMIWATAVGVGIAGAAVSGATPQQIYSAPVNMLQAADVAQAVAGPAACVAGWNSNTQSWANEAKAAQAANPDINPGPDPGLQNLSWGMTSSTSQDGRLLTLSFGANPDNTGGYTPIDCGTVTFNLPRTDSSDPREAAISSAVSNSLQTEIPKLANAFIGVAGQMTQGMTSDQAQQAAAALQTAKTSFNA